MVPQRLSHYRIIEKIGAGGMCDVYSATDTVLGRKVALKILSEDTLPDEHSQKRFIREARAAAKLDHPNICSVYEVGIDDELCFIAMQYVDGETLASKLRSERLAVEEVIVIAAQIGGALSEAHSKGIIHRDIKPQNIMIDARGQVKVLDFGLAKLMQERVGSGSEEKTQSLLTGPGIIVGTLTYLSPEQARAEALDGRSDIFSLGVVIYEMLSGMQPFKADSSAATISKILTHEPPPLTRFLLDIPSELQRIVSKALCKDKERRYQAVKELQIDLETLKEEIAFEAKLERSNPPEVKNTTRTTDSIDASVTAERELTLKSTEPTSLGKAPHPWYLARPGVRKQTYVMALLLCVVAAAAFAYLSYSDPIDSVAVLPFVFISTDATNMADADREYLSDGVTESVINDLSQLRKLKVIARSSVFRYKGKEIDPQQVGRELGVRTVFIGRIIQRGDNLTIKAELSDVRDNSQIWGSQYDRRISDLLSLQREIATNIIDSLRLKLTGEDKTRLAREYTKNAEAYELYLKGRYYWNKRSEDGFRKAITLFDQAIKIDSKYALAYAGLADAYMLLSDWGFLTPTEGYAKAKQAALQAVSIDDRLAEAHTSLAGIRVVLDWDWAGAENEYKRAIELNPNYPTARHWYASHLIVMGRVDESLAEIKQAQQLDPLSLPINKDLAVIFLYARRYDQALEQCTKTLEIDPDYLVMSTYRAQAYELKQMYLDALSELQRAHSRSPDDIEVSYGLAQAYAAMEMKGEAKRILDELTQPVRQFIPKEMAVLYLRLGDRDKAFEILRSAYEDHYFSVAELKMDPRFDGLRSDPRYSDLLRRLGLGQ